jgi:hypothetical protein
MKVHSKQISRLHELEKLKQQLNFKLNEDIQDNKLNENRIPELENLIREEEIKMSQAQLLKEQYLEEIEKEIEFRDDLKSKKSDLSDTNLKMKSALKNEMYTNGELIRNVGQKESEVKKLEAVVKSLEDKYND